MKVVLAQLPCIEGDTAANLAAIEAAWQQADPAADLLVFPELQLTGFAEHGHTADRALNPDTAPELQGLAALSRRRNQAAAVGFLENRNGRIFNATAFITPEDGIRCLYRKTHLWDTEQQLIEAGNEFVCTEWRGVRWGMITCFDIEFPESARCTAALNCDVLLVCDGNMDPYLPVHLIAARARAVENQMFVCLSNRCGSGMGLHFSGHSLAVDPYGQVLAEAGEEEILLPVDLDLGLIPQSKAEYHYLQQRRVLPQGEAVTEQHSSKWMLS